MLVEFEFFWFSKGGDHALLQYVTVHVGIHGSLNEL